MCGIAGIIADDPELVSQSLPGMVQSLIHRGPDDAGIVQRRLGDSFVGLGFRRLAIMDLSMAGHQPMVHPQTGSCLIFNGEIYNYRELRRDLQARGVRLTGNSDTEVLLHALEQWGQTCLERLEGMYAFAWLDGQGRRLLLARDPLGIKPLYIARLPRALIFASEIRGLLASGLVPPTLDRGGLAGFLAYGVTQQPRTLIESVRSFPAGHYQFLGGGKGDSAPVSFFHFPEPREYENNHDAAAAIRASIQEAVRSHLMSDVPVGIFLSSGLDSTAIASMAAAHCPGLRSFTVGFADQPELSETSVAAQTAHALGLKHTDIQVLGPDALRLTQDWLDSVDRPSIDGLNVFIISKMVREAGVTVALSGQGADELFGGYPSFEDVPRLLRYRHQLRLLPAYARRLLATTTFLGRHRAAREKLGDMAEGPCLLLDLYLQRRRMHSNRQMEQLGLDARSLDLAASFQPQEAIAELPARKDPIGLISLFELIFYQGNMLLRDADANSMAHSLELRVPFLDKKVVQLASSLPGKVRLPGGRADKHLLRQAMGSILPPGFRPAPKKGFVLPLSVWMRTSLRDLSEQALVTLKLRAVLVPSAVDRVWSEFLKEPNGPAWSRAFALVTLGHYLHRTGLS